jgi:lysophospholipase L1-like esterase
VVASAKNSGVPTWVTTSQPRTLDAHGIALLERLRDTVLEEFKDRSLNFWTPLAAARGAPLPSLNQGDGIHPNTEGHRLLFEVVKAADVPGHAGTR